MPANRLSSPRRQLGTLVVFTRVPERGHGKQRLRPALGDGVVDRLTAAMLADTCAWPLAGHDTVVLAHDGPAGQLPTSAVADRYVAQPDTTFGARIAHAFDAAFAAGGRRVVMVGSDCPTLPGPMLEAAFGELRDAGATMVSADDGGWILLGLRAPLGVALDGIAWSAATTGSETAAALAADGRAPRIVGSWYDVDEPADLDRLGADLAADPSRAPRTAEALRLGSCASA